VIRSFCHESEKAAVKGRDEPMKRETSINRINVSNEKRLKKRIAEMLKERTGSHFLDSGRAYGRHWQRNLYRDFDKEREYLVSIHADNEGRPEEIIVLHNLYHYLVTFLSLDKGTTYLNRRFKQFSHSKYMEDENWLSCVDEFLVKKLKISHATENTYNHANVLSQIIQYSIFQWGVDSSDYIILQIHGGCDVRGGYTKPYIFKVTDINSFYQAQVHVEALCTGMKHDPRQTCFEGLDTESTCSNWWSSCDAGLRYYFHGCSSEMKPIEEYTRYDKDMQKLLCKDCGGDIAFTV
jgi:hypothetical protein